MPLSRLQNFLKNAKGNVLYVNPNDIDSTDSIENQGNSLTRPFKTIQRALIEAARFSYQSGLDNDRFAKTTIILYPGDHIVDNRPGWIPYAEGNNVRYFNRAGTNGLILSPFSLTSNFDVTTAGNDLFKLNSVYGGVIIPRGTSIVGLDLRKTKIRPRYIPNPSNDNIERSAIFRLTGSCYLNQFSLFDGDPNGRVFKDFTTNTFVPNFSHHKLTCFEYADGVNYIDINDDFLTYADEKTDLDIYYQKVGDVYDQDSGRAIEPDFPAGTVDIQTKVDEYRIVGPQGGEVGITSIKAGDGVVATTTITVNLSAPLDGLDVDTAILVEGVTASGYNGQQVVSGVTSTTEFQYKVSGNPTIALENPANATVGLAVDTVTSASPYVFNVTMRSVYGMCGLHADGKKASGFKAMTVAQFTGISLQKDNDAFIKYNTGSAIYDDSTSIDNIQSNSSAVYKPAYRNYHIKASNDAFIQAVAVFGVGFDQHFLAESGADQSITNSNSNFGAHAFSAQGFKEDAFARDDVGYISHIIPPKIRDEAEQTLEFSAIDVAKTVGVGSTSRLYLLNETNSQVPPRTNIEGYRLGAKVNEDLNCLIPVSGSLERYQAKVIFSNTANTSNEVSSEKRYTVGRVAGVNSITSNTIALTEYHQLSEGETIRFESDTGQLPDGIDDNTLYYAITSGINTDSIKIAKTLNEALSGQEIAVNSLGGTIKVLSRVSDKIPGEIGHPVQYDNNQRNWYVSVGTATTENTLFTHIAGPLGVGTTVLGSATPRTFIVRQPDNRSLEDRIYKLRYVIPSGISSARPPLEGYVLQESNDTLAADSAEISATSLTNFSDQRNFKFIANAEWDEAATSATIVTEVPHGFDTGATVEIINVKSSENTIGLANTGFNRDYIVTGITSARGFTVGLNTDPGTLENDTSLRTIAETPYVKRKRYNNTYYIYQSREIRKHIPSVQDGVYHIVALNASVAPTISPFTADTFSQNVVDLYPQVDRDNPQSDPVEARSFAKSSLIGKVVTNDLKKSITKETTVKFIKDSGIGIALTDIHSNVVTGTAHTLWVRPDHGLNGVTAVSIASSGAGYGSGAAGDIYNVELVGVNVGINALAKITVDAVGGVTDVVITDGGSAYGIGQTAVLVSTATTTGFSQATVQVTGIITNFGDGVRVSGVKSESFKGYNELYQITGITTRSIQVSSASSVLNCVASLGSTIVSEASATLTGQSIGISSITFDPPSGIATVTSSSNHGLSADNIIRIVGTAASIFNEDHPVQDVVGVTTFTLRVGVASELPFTATLLDTSSKVLRTGLTAQEGTISINEENTGGRMVPIYAGITTTLSATIPNTSATTISITNFDSSGLRKGDFIIIDNEVMRISNDAGSSVFRGALGTKASSHEVNAIIRKIKVIPSEIRRVSLNRASGHTFEYLGYGPGNYSTSLPNKQDKVLSGAEKLLSQSINRDSGKNVYTGMDNEGNFYTGNVKTNPQTGKDEIFNTPVATVTGENLTLGEEEVGFDIITPDEVLVTRKIAVTGGPDSDILSEFSGPVVFSRKVTFNGRNGIEANSIFLQGDATISRNVGVATSTPTVAGTPGDIKFFASPSAGGYAGWVYTVDNDWYRFANVSTSSTENVSQLDRLGIASAAGPGDAELVIGLDNVKEYSAGYDAAQRDGLIVAIGGSLGIGTTRPDFDLHVANNIYAAGFVTARTYLYGDGSRISNLPNDSLWVPNDTVAGANPGVHTVAGKFVGIGSTQPDGHLTIGLSTTTTNKAFVIKSGFTTEFVGVDTNGRMGILKPNPQGLLDVGGQFISTQFSLDGSAGIGTIFAGIVTASDSLYVGKGNTTAISAGSTGTVGVGTSGVRATLDVDGRIRFKSHFEPAYVPPIASNVVTLELDQANTFTITVTDAITNFKLANPPSEASNFTVKIVQDAIGHQVGIDSFKDNDGNIIPVYWSNGIVPQVSTGGDQIDIYSFFTFDGGASLFGVTGGQNFS